MQRIGIIGGLGPESTLDYYRLIIDAFKQAGGGFNYPEVIIHSLDLGRFMHLVEEDRWPEIAEWLAATAESLARAGADFAAIASNTPHLVFDEVQARSPLPLVSIVQAALDQARSRGFSRPGLLGTRLTMGSDLYQRAFGPAGLKIAVPLPDDQELIHQRLFSEIELGIIKDSTRQELLAVIDRMITDQQVDSVILGCTELPLILDMPEHGVPLLDTTKIHVKAIVARCR